MAGPWPAASAPALDSASLEALLDDRVGLVTVPGFLPPARCAELVERFLAGPRQTHDYGFVKVSQVGFSSKMVVEPADRYFDDAAKVYPRLRALYAGGEDPLLKVREAVAAAGWKVEEALERGRPYCRDMVFALHPGSRLDLHRDASKEKKGLVIHRFGHQLTWNLYLAAPESGGELLVFRTRSRPARRLVRGAGAVEVSTKLPLLRYRPRAGELVLFDPGYYHEVTQVGGAALRVNAHSFIGFDRTSREASFFT